MNYQVSTRHCYWCNLECPENPDKLDSRGDQMLMDPNVETIEHWKVCPEKKTPEEIKKALFFHKKQIEKQVKQLGNEMKNKTETSLGHIFDNVEKFNPNTYVIPKAPMEGMNDAQKLDYVLVQFDKTLKALKEEQIIIVESIAAQLTMINRTLATLASNQRSIMRKVGIPDT